MGVHTLNNSRAFSCQRLKHTVPIPFPVRVSDLSVRGVGRHYLESVFKLLDCVYRYISAKDGDALTPRTIILSCMSPIYTPSVQVLRLPFPGFNMQYALDGLMASPAAEITVYQDASAKVILKGDRSRSSMESVMTFLSGSEHWVVPI